MWFRTPGSRCTTWSGRKDPGGHGDVSGLLPLFKALFSENYISPLKYAMAQAGVPCGASKLLPLLEAKDETKAWVDSEDETLGCDLITVGSPDLPHPQAPPILQRLTVYCVSCRKEELPCPMPILPLPNPPTDPFKSYLPGSPERAELKAELARQSAQVVKIPSSSAGRGLDGQDHPGHHPHDHQHVIAGVLHGGEKELKMAVDAALAAKDAWEEMPWEHRSAIFLKAADLITGSYRQVLNASTMLGQSKTVFQAEIDIAELADFLRFGVWSAQEIFKDQPLSVDGIWNRQDYRPLDGFICAISPFNFTSIGGNLPTAPPSWAMSPFGSPPAPPCCPTTTT